MTTMRCAALDTLSPRITRDLVPTDTLIAVKPTSGSQPLSDQTPPDIQLFPTGCRHSIVT